MKIFLTFLIMVIAYPILKEIGYSFIDIIKVIYIISGGLTLLLYLLDEKYLFMGDNVSLDKVTYKPRNKNILKESNILNMDNNGESSKTKFEDVDSRKSESSKSDNVNNNKNKYKLPNPLRHRLEIDREKKGG
jgi:hypothetical protein